MTTEEALEVLCENVKRKCSITWTDEDTENTVKTIVEDAVEAMRHKLGIAESSSPEAFLKAGTTRTLFENYCLYAWNHMVDEFEKNYRSMILMERHRYEVEYGKTTST